MPQVMAVENPEMWELHNDIHDFKSFVYDHFEILHKSFENTEIYDHFGWMHDVVYYKFESCIAGELFL